MLPISIKLNNFMSYGANCPPLNFGEFNIACITGQNGHGKSTLNDALTWAVWGEARHRTPNLVRLGQTHMSVEFEFEHGGERYLISRAFRAAASGSGTSRLELQIFDREANEYRSLARGSIRETQQRILDIVRMDYDTFVASAYLKQGAADAFTRQQPARRKEILGEILGLAHYSRIAEGARARARDKTAAADALAQQIAGIEEFLQGRAEAQRQVAACTANLEQIRPQVAALEEQLHARQALHARLSVQLGRRDTIATELAAARAKLSEQDAASQKLNERLRTLNSWRERGPQLLANKEAHDNAKSVLERWDGVAGQWHVLDRKISDLRMKISTASTVLNGRRGEIESHLTHNRTILAENQAKLDAAGAVREGVQQLTEARAAEAAWARKRGLADTAREQLQAAQEAVRAARLQTENDLNLTLNQLEREEADAAGLADAEQTLAHAEAEIARVREAETEIAQLREQRAAIDVELAEMKAEVEAARARAAANDAKLKLLTSDHAGCPLCEAQLGADGLARVWAKIDGELETDRQFAEKKTEQGREKRAAQRGIDEQLAQKQQFIDANQCWEPTAAAARQRIETARAAQARVEELRTRRLQLEEALASGSYAPAEIEAERAAQAALDNIGYDAAAHNAATQQLADLAHYEQDAAGLEFARKQIEDATARIASLEPQLAAVIAEIESGAETQADRVELSRLESEAEALGYDESARDQHQRARADFQQHQNAALEYDRYQQAIADEPALQADREAHDKAQAELAGRVAALEAEQAGLAQAQADLTECEAAIAETRQRLQEQRDLESQATAELGRQQGILKTCEEQQQKRDELEAERVDVESQAHIHQQTAAAFGKDGIPALIIENAIPELEREANALLARLSSTNMRLSINSLRETVDGGLRETIDIIISDDHGTREYLMYSGGEAFRADFALRVALSKLLARRAGAPLRMLIIDEGFGTQDAQGLQQMIECIQAIQDDFDKVLVVTHLPELKNAFPMRIEVTKTGDLGSRFTLVRN